MQVSAYAYNANIFSDMYVWFAFLILGGMVSSRSVEVTTDNRFAALSCELYGYLPVQLPTIVWNFGGDQLTNDSVYTITIESGSHMIQNGGDSPQSSVKSILTINHPNKTHEGTYLCSASSNTMSVTLQVIKGRSALI